MKDFDEFERWYNDGYSEHELEILDKLASEYGDDSSRTPEFLYRASLMVSEYRLRKYHEWMNS